ncbi:hypothetical protein Daus18300_006407 [Diaporthe australafricana]|uniref:Mid2 domain-containing protein n=1 Tax=Diaporthe australafricana TaxID=127596 RepID=A0ABR3WUC7_9PEZI
MTTTSSVSLNENLASSTPNTILTVTITSLAPTVSSESALITDNPNTVSCDLTLVYVFTKSATDESSSSSASSSTGSSRSGLSTGAIAGIVIGSIIFLIFLVLVVFCTSRRFARKRRREETSLHHSEHHPSRASRAPPSSYHKAQSQRSTVYSPSSPPQELATQFNRLQVDGRGRPVEVLGSYKHPVELQAGSTADLVAHVRKGGRPPAGLGKSGAASVIYIMPARSGDDIRSEGISGRCLSPGTWETESWAASVSGQSQMVSGPGTHATPSKASSRDTLGYSTHTKE